MLCRFFLMMSCSNFSKLYMLKSCNISTTDFLTIYKGYVRSLLKYAVPVWNAGLTAKQVDVLESGFRSVHLELFLVLHIASDVTLHTWASLKASLSYILNSFILFQKKDVK